MDSFRSVGRAHPDGLRSMAFWAKFHVAKGNG